MNKKSLLLFLALSTAMVAVCQEKINGYYGNVKFCKTVTVNAKSQFGQVVTLDTTSIKEINYNSRGNDIGSRTWTPNSEIVTVFKLDENNKRIHGTRYNNSVIESEYWYDDDDRMLRLYTTYLSGSLKGTISDTRYVYNEMGQHLRDSSFNENGELKRLTIYEYGKDSLLEVKTLYTADGSVLSSTKYYYDDNKREKMTAESVSYSDSKSYTSTEYDDKGRKRTFSRASSRGIYEYSYHYLDFGHDEYTTMFQKTTTKSGKSVSQTDYEYEYDEHGNWIKKITYNVNIGNDIKVAKTIQFREIEYF